MSEPLLRIEGVQAKYGDFIAVHSASLDVPEGKIVSLIGSNGAGKSTLFNAIGGSFFTDEGSIELDGQDITMMPEHKRAKMIGRLFQDPMLGTAPDLSIMDNMALSAGKGGWLSILSNKEKKDFRDRVSVLGMGLEDRMSQPVRLLSGGQRQALTLLMATYHPPKLLLLDEHTAALDPGTAEKVLNITQEVISANNLTCLMITHNMQNALDLGNRTIMMNQGNIIYDVRDEERAGLTVNDLLDRFKTKVGEALDNDRILLSE